MDFSLSNPLLTITRGRTSKLLVKHPDVTTLFNMLVKKGKSMKLPVIVYDYNLEEYTLKDHGEICFEGDIEEIRRKMNRLYTLSRLSMEEKGIVTLFMTFGILEWNDPDFPVQHLSAPLVMVPCEFERSKHTHQVLKINFIGEDVLFNPALELLFREKYKLPLPEISEVKSIDLERILEHMKTLKTQFTIWRILSQSWLVVLNPEMFILYNDLGNMLQNEEALKHPLIMALSRVLPPFRGENSAETEHTVPLVPVLETDSSQREILKLVREGKNLVVHGPPGTGKSQTIANIIADALARDKTVLFVSAKKAALDVVYNRLKSIGLEKFCLEVHNTKKSKLELMEDLRKTIDFLKNLQDVGQPIELLNQFKHLKDLLNDSLNSLHRTDRPLGISVYDAISKLEELKDYPSVHFSLNDSLIANTSKEELAKYLQTLEKLEQLADVYVNESQHPWKGYKFFKDALTYPSKTIEMLGYIKINLEKVKQLLEKAGFSDIDGLCFNDFQKILSLLKSLRKVDIIPAKWFKVDIKTLSMLKQLFELYRKQKILMKKYYQHTEKPIEEMIEILQPMEYFLKSWTRVLKPSYWKWIKFVNNSLKYPHNFENIKRLYDIVRNIVDGEAKFNELKEKFSNQEVSPDEYIMDTNVEIESLLEKLKITLEIRGKVSRTILKGDLILDEESKEFISKAIEILEDSQLKKIMEAMNKLWPEGFMNGMTFKEVPLRELLQKIDHLINNESKLYEWVQLQEVIQDLESMGLGTFIRSVEKEHVKNIRRLFEKSFYKQWIDHTCAHDEFLSRFQSREYEKVISVLQKTEESLRKSWVNYIKSSVAQKFQRVMNNPENSEYTKQMQILMREIQKRRRHKPIRKFFLEVSDVLRLIKPCMLMSPLSVASFLDLERFINYFDIVIFDEASQLRTPEAIPAVVRGKQIVVAGDPKQLPPTSFFKSYYESDDESDEKEPLESFLDECIALPQMFKQGYLKWHYRSRDEQLIAFSNHYFYNDNPLITFPSPKTKSPHQGVKLVYVENGVWERSGRRVNFMEAQRVVDIVIEHLQKFSERSIGVVTMNISQRDLIEDLLYRRLEEFPELRNILFEKSNEPFFVKSLENVQGDERDTIVISIGYAKTPSGDLFYNFGPLNHEAGWRRFNVLVTRARYQIILVTSLRSDDLSRVNPENRGVMALKNYLRYAEQNCHLEFDHSIEKFEDVLPSVIAQRLSNEGLSLDTNIGMGLCQVSIGVRDSENSEGYVMGIIHDGKNHFLIQDAFDREVLKFKVLQRLGWSIKRIWTIEWYRDQEKVLKDITESLQSTKKESKKLAHEH
ncbi:DUF4011 domain-containing protein [Thermotoga sp. SG1]|uniref:DUF4011 domain-containing protein n=1 Tax=Thermotoga sp. SG1 TaxID=126739 RepID=UPI000CBD6255|nr:DUF4011 domain-containing protein [Thermotoga sp. SG1]PLV57031.1 AAA family ATPase [Thermotoga sp. SG1]